MSHEKIEVEIAPGKVITLETGKLAKQADGSALVSMGKTMVLVTVCVGREMDADFFPLMVEYREKTYSVGRFPGGYLKREARPADREVLTSRLIDRPLRPLFPDGMRREVQITATVINGDGIQDGESVAICGASLVVGLSSLPFENQIAAVKVCRINGAYVVNPTYTEMEQSDMDLIVAGSAQSIVMVEGGGYEISEQEMVDAIMTGHEAIKKIVAAQEELIKLAGSKPTMEVLPPAINEELFQKVESICLDRLKTSFQTAMAKQEHYSTMADIKNSVVTALAADYPESETEIKSYFSKIEQREMREVILQKKFRIDGRKTDEIRPISVESGLLPNCHGSALFQRGETQALVVCTLGSRMDEQKVESLRGEAFKNYYLHYNFPPYSVGETGRLGTPGRREIGHGHLAERSLAPVLPVAEDFPYTIRLVSEILESNGSSSMASVCGGSLALMETGVPTKTNVAGIAMGLISDGDRVEILSDITGTEDHLGDMDFKICGTANGITGFQMDIKIKGITPELMLRALEQARKGRLHILEIMNGLLAKPKELSKLAPAVMYKQIPQEKIKDIIGPGGKMVRSIQESSGANLDIQDSGMVTITAPKRGNAQMALRLIEDLFQEVEIGKQYKGKVKNITNFGAFVEVLPGKEGLVHISELDIEKGKRMEDILSTGDEIDVKCINIDAMGRVRLSARQAEKVES